VVTGAALILTSYFCLEKSVTIIVDEKVIEQRTFKKTVGELLQANQISLNPHDTVDPGLDQALAEDMVITVTRGFQFTVVADGETHELTSVPIQVAEALELAKVKLGEKDLVSAQLEDFTCKGQVIQVTRVEEKMISESTDIPFLRETTLDNNLETGLIRTVSRGRTGTALQLIKVTYHDGQEVSREVIESEVVKPPVNEVVARGTINSVSRGNIRLDFTRALYCQSTAYTYTGRRTATGKTPAVGLIATDPNVIPMGTRLYVEGYGYAVAADRGSSIKGDKIDIFLETTQQCLNWGRRTVKVYVLK